MVKKAGTEFLENPQQEIREIYKKKTVLEILFLL